MGGRATLHPSPESLSPSGYNQIFIVPAGATSIRIEEVAASRNFLGKGWVGELGQGSHPVVLCLILPTRTILPTAVKNVRGEYYLNGHWTIQEAQALPVANTILQYELGAEGDLAPERLQARGPTSEPLVIEVSRLGRG
jgi:hypothetical protein